METAEIHVCIKPLFGSASYHSRRFACTISHSPSLATSKRTLDCRIVMVEVSRPDISQGPIGHTPSYCRIFHGKKSCTMGYRDKEHDPHPLIARCIKALSLKSHKELSWWSCFVFLARAARLRDVFGFRQQREATTSSAKPPCTPPHHRDIPFLHVIVPFLGMT